MANYWELEDMDLVELVRQNDEQAFSMLYVRYGALLIRHALRMLNDVEEAQDTVQNVFTDLWDRRESLQVATSVSGYLYAATRHAVLRQLRNGRQGDDFLQHLAEVADAESEPADAALREAELRRLIEVEIDQLPPKMREVFLMSRRDHLSHREIAQKLGLSENTVKRQTSNALAILRKRLGHLYGVAIFLL